MKQRADYPLPLYRGCKLVFFHNNPTSGLSAQALLYSPNGNAISWKQIIGRQRLIRHTTIPARTMIEIVTLLENIYHVRFKKDGIRSSATQTIFFVF